MSLRDVMMALKELEEGLALPEDVRRSMNLNNGKVRRAYLIAPPSNQNLNDLPCFLNWPDTGEDLGGMGQDAEENHYTIQIDFYAPNNDKGAEIALAFFDLTWNALKAEKPFTNRLGGTVANLTVRAERPLLELIEWNRLGYPGFHMFLDVELFAEVAV